MITERSPIDESRQKAQTSSGEADGMSLVRILGEETRSTLHVGDSGDFPMKTGDYSQGY